MLKRRILEIFFWSFLASCLTAMVCLEQADKPCQRQSYNNDNTKGYEIKNNPLLQKIFPDPNSFFNFSLVIVTGCLAVIGIIQASAAKKSAEVGEHTFIAGQRPFVCVIAPKIDDGLVWEEYGARTTILFAIKNVGKSPAFDISAQANQFVLGREKPDVSAELIKFCAAVRRQRNLPLAKGDVLFPGEVLPQKHGLMFDRAEIDNNAKCNGAFFWPIVLICVDYRSSITERRHTTGLVYDLFHIENGLTKMITVGEALPANVIGLARHPEGSFAD
jgi:hypothetical protein